MHTRLPVPAAEAAETAEAAEAAAQFTRPRLVD